MAIKSDNPDLYYVRKTKDKGQGAFAARAIKKGEHIGDYTGELVTDMGESYVHMLCGFTMLMHASKDEEMMYDGDHPKYGSTLRFLNHSCNPNCELRFSKPKHERDLIRNMLYAIRPIAKDEEMTFDYLLEGSVKPDWFKAKWECRCGAANCQGDMFAWNYKSLAKQEATFKKDFIDPALQFIQVMIDSQAGPRNHLQETTIAMLCKQPTDELKRWIPAGMLAKFYAKYRP